MQKRKELMKIEVDVDNFREIWAKEWDMLEKELKCSINPHDPNSLRMKYPHLFKYLMDTLNQIREQAREEAEKEGE